MTQKEYDRRRYEKYKPIYDMFIALYPFTLEDLPGELWLPIPDYEAYHGSNFGRVKSFYNDKVTILKPTLSSRGYLVVGLHKNGKQKHCPVHALVARLFIPNPENKPEINHIYSRFSNHVDCLEWASKSENQKHAVRTGLRKSGEESYQAKFTNEQVVYIRENPEGLNTYQLAEKFSVAQTTISDIQLGKIWKQVGGTIREKKFTKSIITDDKRAQILADYQPGVRGHGYTSVAKRFGINAKSVQNIVRQAQ